MPVRPAGGVVHRGPGGEQPDKGIKYRHAWNVVRLGDAYYHLTPPLTTRWDRRSWCADYFNLDDRRLFRDHEALVYPVPACADGGRFYYREARLSFTRPEEVAGRAAQAVRKGSPWCSTGGAAP